MALASFWHLARHWQQDEGAKLEISKKKSQHTAESQAWTSPSQLLWEERRHHAAKTNVEEAKSTQNLSAEDIAPSKEADKPKL